MTLSGQVIDAHVHCGIIDTSWPQSLEDYSRHAAGTEICGVAVFSPVMEIYDRYDRHFIDTPQWRERRRQSNAYLLSLNTEALAVYPYFFIWNDFAVEDLASEYRGIKWHRHAGEPVYAYDDQRCRKALDVIRRRRLPVVLEEEFGNTLHFIRGLAPGITVIIPHLGMLNGGFQSLAAEGLWELDNVWADTALASSSEIREYVRRYGHHRLMFGSDYPFGDPASELHKILNLDFDPEAVTAIVGGNFTRLQARVAAGVG